MLPVGVRNSSGLGGRGAPGAIAVVFKRVQLARTDLVHLGHTLTIRHNGVVDGTTNVVYVFSTRGDLV